MVCALTETDVFGRLVALDHSNWQNHLAYRPELATYHDLVPATLAVPDFVIRADRDGQDHFYRAIPGMPGWLHIVVAIGVDGWKIRTCWYATRARTRGKRLWPR